MARVRSKKRLRELFADIPVSQRARFIRKAIDLAESGCDDLLSDPDAKPRNKIEAAKSAAQTIDLIMGLYAHVTGEEEAIQKLARGLLDPSTEAQGVTVNIVCPPETDPCKKPDS